MIGELDSCGALVGKISDSSCLSGNVNGTSNLVGTINCTGCLNGSINGTSILVGTINCDGCLSGNVNGTSNIVGKVSRTAEITGRLDLYNPPTYHGGYEITPSEETQTLSTHGKLLESDVVVNPIPNNYGLITWNGSVITVS